MIVHGVEFARLVKIHDRRVVLEQFVAQDADDFRLRRRVEVIRTRRLAFRIHPADVLALAFAALVCVYAVLPQDLLGGTADRSAIGLALKHDLAPVGAYLLGQEVTVKGDWAIRKPKLAPGGWAFEFENDLYPDTDDAAVISLALRQLGVGG